jgi:GNAT superfamily N-acetyltransferase
MSLSYRENYWDDAAAKAEFNRFLKELFNLDLARWGEAGFWDEKFRPFSFIEGSTLAANVCVYSMNMSVAGRDCRVAQVSSVGTRPDYRRQGLARKLTAKAVEWARDTHDFFFLFADKDAFPFYARSGFRLRDEYRARIAVEGQMPVSTPTKLDVNNAEHLQRINRMAAERTPASKQLGVYNRRLFMFWLLYFLRDQVYYIPELDLLVLFERKDDLVVVSDIVGREIPPFAEIYPHIAAVSDRFVDFQFMPDRLKVRPVEWTKVTENGLHLMGDFPLDGKKFLFPLTSHA